MDPLSGLSLQGSLNPAHFWNGMAAAGYGNELLNNELCEVSCTLNQSISDELFKWQK